MSEGASLGLWALFLTGRLRRPVKKAPSWAPKAPYNFLRRPGGQGKSALFDRAPEGALSKRVPLRPTEAPLEPKKASSDIKRRPLAYKEAPSDI